MLMPFMRAASKTLVPAGTRMDWPSIVMSTRLGGVVAVVISGANTNALRFSGAAAGVKQMPLLHWPFKNVRVNLGAKMFQDRLNRCGHDLAEATDRSQAHGLRELVEQREVGAVLGFGTPPCVQRTSISVIFCEPTRQGTHLPQDSLR